MRVRALLALLVLLGTLPVQGGGPSGDGRAAPGPTVLFLDAGDAVAHGLSKAAPGANGSVVLARDESARFDISNLSGLRAGTGAGELLFRLELRVVSLIVSPLALSCELELDLLGNGSSVNRLALGTFETHNLTVAETAVLEAGAPGGSLGDLRHGSVRLTVARNDTVPGLLEILCGTGQNASTLALPYGGPLRADAGSRTRAVKTNGTLALDGTGSETVDPGAATQYLWDLGDGQNATGRQVSHRYDRPGVYNVTLKLRWDGQEDADTVVVTVSDNRPPVADAGRNITKRAGEGITFRGYGSDPDGHIVSYEWSFGDGSNDSRQNATHSYGAPGDYDVLLTVRDNDGADGTAGLRVHINHPPRILGMTATYADGRQSFNVVAEDPDGTLLAYDWDFGDGSVATPSGPSVSHRYDRTGNYTVRCTVTDPYGDSASATLQVSLNNTSPQINSLGLPSARPVVNQAVRFRPDVRDAEGDRLDYAWSFGDGGTSTDQSPTHYYTRSGRFTVRLVVTDGYSQSTRSETLQVDEGSALPIDSDLWSFIFCMAMLIISMIISVAKAIAAARKRQEQGGLPEVREPGAPVKGLPPPAAPYGGQYQPYQGAPPAPPRPARPARVPPGVCPRCGSAEVQRFPDGHAKCLNCKKIFFTG